MLMCKSFSCPSPSFSILIFSPFFNFARLFELLPLHEPEIATVNVAQEPKGIDPRFLSWKGASIISKDSTNTSMWITATEWERLGVRALREKAPYSFEA